ncbi:hypothetical protein UU7_14425 [Rhodanobacter spathiphylli B39]|uniref:Uncharacterized protein n=1 Tax=Rhodanobacter spathiphylli B39 TaxID=1163407 RepID=I4VV06_9GAMM|nr:hypothetical protein UU7_14425 [Rhodanobacter spathiphylli B39]
MIGFGCMHRDRSESLHSTHRVQHFSDKRALCFVASAVHEYMQICCLRLRISGKCSQGSLGVRGAVEREICDWRVVCGHCLQTEHVNVAVQDGRAAWVLADRLWPMQREQLESLSA